MTFLSSKALQFSVRLAFHASLSGAFLVAYLTGDEDTYHMHVFAGYLVLVTAGLRILVGLWAPDGSLLRLPQPQTAPLCDWLRRLVAGDPSVIRGRSPLLAWLAAGALATVAIAAATGVVADFVTKAEHLHEALSEFALWMVVAHVAVLVILNWLKRVRAPAAA